MEKSNMVTYEDELNDSLKLIDKIRDSGWVKKDMVVVNCFPEYSSRVAHLVSHKLSYLNGNEPFEIVNLKMPYPTMIQVWDEVDQKYRPYIQYLADWTRRNVQPLGNYLFIGSEASTTNYSKLKTMLRGKLEMENFMIASLYTKKDGFFTPDIFIREYEGDIIFQWENMNNPNWNRKN